VPIQYIFNAVVEHLVRWVSDGTLPPAAPPIDISDAGPPARIARDATGNALGGIRLSQHAVPAAVNTGVNSEPIICPLAGSHEPFDAATLARLYPTHERYVAQVREVTQRNVAAGYLLKIDGDATIAEAEMSAIAR
jgi:hypothetical protein